VGGTPGTTDETVKPGNFAMGVNLDGMEYGNQTAVANYNYAIPTLSELQYYKSQGLNLIRLPLSWTTLQPTLGGPLSASYLANIETVVNEAASLGIKIILDIHAFGGYGGSQLGTAAVTDADFANLWQQLSQAFAGNPGIGGYDLMNEPNNMPSATAWTSAAQAAITAIRTEDTTTPIYVEGNDWANSTNWAADNPGFANLVDPSNNLIFSAHVYLDNNDSGTNYDWATQAAGGDTTNIGVQRLQSFVQWLQANNLKGDIGEIGAGNDNPAWLTALDNTLAYIQANSLQVTYWDAGPWLGTYPYSVEPTNGVPAPQMAVLDKYTGDYPTVTKATVSGTADPNATIYLSENEVLLATTTANASGNWSYTLNGLSYGVHIIVAGESLPTVDGTIAATTFDLVAPSVGGATCFAAGTHILTPNGEVAVEHLRIGDSIQTWDGASQTIKWIGRRSYDGRYIAGQHLMLPITIKKDALADGMPARDLTVSPGHAIYVDGALIPAWRLVNGLSVVQAEAVQSVTYIHIELADHDLIVAEGCPTESFLDASLRHQFQNVSEYYALGFDDLSGRISCAPRVEGGFLLQAIQERINKRAGLAAQPKTPGRLRGYIDQAVPGLVTGWAQCEAAPETPVCLDILVDGRRAARVLANYYRKDLRDAQLGSGCHAFQASLPLELAGNFEVRRSEDQAMLAMTEEAALRAA
jgi:aryl-phospho-beta-D-glucosidase BglC (GH1 family)